MTQIILVRVLRTAEMQLGIAVDADGKRWRGFQARGDHEMIRLSGDLGPVGLCCVCGERVFCGWECLSERKDACLDCVSLAADRIFVMTGEKDWLTLEQEFWTNENFHL